MDINSITSRAAKWSMEGDCMLFQWMQEISQSLETQSLKVSTALAQLNTDLHRNTINLDNASNNLSSLQHTQFVENLCQEDYSELQQQHTANPVEQAEVPSNPVDNMRNFLNNNMNVINECSEKYSLEMDDSDDEGENSYIYQLKNPYNDRLLPHIYGTKLWNDFSHVGLCLGNNSVEEEEFPEAFDESSTSQVYDANNSSSCSLSQWASSTSLANENNKSLTNIKSYPVFDEMSEQITTTTSPLEISSSALPQLYENLAPNVPVQQTITPASQTEKFLPRTRFEKPEMDQIKIMPKKQNDPLPVSTTQSRVTPTENETLTKIVEEKNAQLEKSIPPKNESFLKFQAKVLFDDDDEDDDFLNIFSKSKVQTAKPEENKIADDLESTNIISNKKQGPAYLKELESKLFTKHDVKQSHTVDELDEGIFSRAIPEKLAPAKKNYANVLSNEPPDDFDDFLPVPSHDKIKQTSETNKFTSKDYNAFGFFNEIPPDDDDFFVNEKVEQKDSPQHFIDSPKITKPTTNVAKLKMPNININVQALLPQSPATSKNLEPEKVLEKSPATSKNLEPEKVLEEKKSTVTEHEYVLQNVCKNRVRASAKRRPSTRQGRLSNYKQANSVGTEENDSVETKSTKNIDSFIGDLNKVMKNKTAQDVSIVEEDENKLAEKQPIMSSESVTEYKKVMEKGTEFLSTLTKSSILFDSPTEDFDDIFSKPLKTENITKTTKDIPEKKTKDLTTLTKSSILFDSPDEDFDDIFAKPLKTEEAAGKQTFEKEKVEDNLTTLTKKSIFLDSPDEDFDDIFAKPLKTTKENDQKPSFENEKATTKSSNNSNETSVIVEKKHKSETIKDSSQKRADLGTFKKSSLFLDSPTEDFDDIFSEKEKTVTPNVEKEDEKYTIDTSMEEDNSMEVSKKSNNIFDGKAPTSLHVNSILTDETPPEDELFSTQQKLEKTGSSTMKLSFLDEIPPEDFDDLLPKNISTKISVPQMVFADDSPPEDFDDLFIKKSNTSKSRASPPERSIFTDEIPPEDFDDLFTKKTVTLQNTKSSSFPYDTPPEDFDDLFMKKAEMSDQMGGSKEQKSVATEELFVRETQSLKTNQKDTIVKEPNSEPVKKSLEKSLFSDSEDENLFFNKATEKVNKPKQEKKMEPTKTKPLFGNESDSDDDLFGAVNSKTTRVVQKPPVVFVEQQQKAGAISKTKSKSLFEDTDEDDDDLFSSTKIVKNTSSFAKMSTTTKIQTKVEKVVKRETNSDNPLADLL